MLSRSLTSRNVFQTGRVINTFSISRISNQRFPSMEGSQVTFNNNHVISNPQCVELKNVIQRFYCIYSPFVIKTLY